MRRRSMLHGMVAVLSLAFAVVAFADNYAIKLAEKGGIGKYLADSKGMTLYVFRKDSPGKSACVGPCVVKWPLYYHETIAVPEGLQAGDFGTITREDGKKQTTYKGFPLYYFDGDKVPGDVMGQGVGNVWFAAGP